ncbi:MAG: hypothetical protein ACP5IB_04500 [Thermoplasmata archaeon]
MTNQESIKGSIAPLAWLLQLITAIFMVFFLGVHLWIMHVEGSIELTIQAILQRIQNPWWKAFYIGFLLVVVYHSLNGLRGIIFDVGIKRKSLINGILWVIAIISIIYGIYLLYSI